MCGCAHVHVQEPKETRGSDFLELEVQVLVRAECDAGNQTLALSRTDKMLLSYLHHQNKNKRTKK